MAVAQHIRSASAARGRLNTYVPNDTHSDQSRFISALTQINYSKSGSIRQILSADTDTDIYATANTKSHGTALFTQDGDDLQLASPQQIIEQARLLITQRFERGASLMDQPDIVDALLRVKLAGESRMVFAALFLDRRYRVLDFAVLFRGTIDGVTIHTREVIRDALFREAEVVIGARNDLAGDADPTERDFADAKKLRDALALVDVVLADYLIVGRSIASFTKLGLL